MRLLCAAHNRYEAEKAFGREHIERRIDVAQAKRRSAQAVAPTRQDEALPSSDPTDTIANKRASLRYALVKDFGFNSAETDRLLATMAPSTWSRPLGSLVVEALGRLTKGAPKSASS